MQFSCMQGHMFNSETPCSVQISHSVFTIILTYTWHCYVCLNKCLSIAYFTLTFLNIYHYENRIVIQIKMRSTLLYYPLLLISTFSGIMCKYKCLVTFLHCPSQFICTWQTGTVGPQRAINLALFSDLCLEKVTVSEMEAPMKIHSSVNGSVRSTFKSEWWQYGVQCVVP
jgi:hypothetical protein